MISAHNVSVWIGRRRIVANVDFEVGPGEVVVVAGPNGSGKTTLMRTLSGDLAYDGDIAFNSRDLGAMTPNEAALVRAVLPQATTLSFPFTVREVVRLGLLPGRSGTLAGEDRRLPDRALARVAGGPLILNHTTNNANALAGNSPLVIQSGGTVLLTGTQFNTFGGGPTLVGLITVDAGGTLSAENTTNNAHNISSLLLRGGTVTSTGGLNDACFGHFVINGSITATVDGASTISTGRLGVNQATTITVADGAAPDDLTISAIISENGGPFAFTKTGAGNLSLSGANTYAGSTTINQGTVTISNPTALGT